MKIFFVTPSARKFAGEFAGVIEANAKRFVRPGTTIDCGYIEEGFQPFPTPTLHQFALVGTVIAFAQSAINAEKAGYDAVVLGCTIDPGLYAARSVVDIPVTAPTESAVLVAHMLGHKYSLVCIDDNQAASIHGNLMRYGLTARLASVRSLGVTSEEAIGLYNDPQKFISAIRKTAQKAISEDGAEVILPGCTIPSTIMSANNIDRIDDVPVIDGVATSIKMAESLVDLKTSCGYGVARRGLYGREKGAPLSLPLKFMGI